MFWLDEPDILFKEYHQILPAKNQSCQQQLNALTRLMLLITLVLLIIQFDMWYVFFLFSMILILILALLLIDTKYENYNPDMDKDVRDVGRLTVTTGPKIKKKKSLKSLEGTTPVYLGVSPEKKKKKEKTRVEPGTLINRRAEHANNSAFSMARHAGSVGYLSADTSNISSETDLRQAKEYAVNDYYSKESLRREKIQNEYAQKRNRDHAHNLEAGGYEPPALMNKHYYREDIAPKRTYNGYVIL